MTGVTNQTVIQDEILYFLEGTLRIAQEPSNCGLDHLVQLLANNFSLAAIEQAYRTLKHLLSGSEPRPSENPVRRNEYLARKQDAEKLIHLRGTFTDSTRTLKIPCVSVNPVLQAALQRRIWEKPAVSNDLREHDARLRALEEHVLRLAHVEDKTAVFEGNANLPGKAPHLSGATVQPAVTPNDVSQPGQTTSSNSPVSLPSESQVFVIHPTVVQHPAMQTFLTVAQPDPATATRTIRIGRPPNPRSSALVNQRLREILPRARQPVPPRSSLTNSSSGIIQGDARKLRSSVYKQSSQTLPTAPLQPAPLRGTPSPIQFSTAATAQNAVVPYLVSQPLASGMNAGVPASAALSNQYLLVGAEMLPTVKLALERAASGALDVEAATALRQLSQLNNTAPLLRPAGPMVSQPRSSVSPRNIRPQVAAAPQPYIPPPPTKSHASPSRVVTKADKRAADAEFSVPQNLGASSETVEEDQNEPKRLRIDENFDKPPEPVSAQLDDEERSHSPEL